MKKEEQYYFRNFGDLSGDSVVTDIYNKRRKRRWKNERRGTRANARKIIRKRG